MEGNGFVQSVIMGLMQDSHTHTRGSGGQPEDMPHMLQILIDLSKGKHKSLEMVNQSLQDVLATTSMILK